MEKSTIIVHWGGYQFSDREQYPTRYFPRLFKPQWLQSDFAKYCIENLDRSEYLGGVLINSPWLGPIGPERLCGSTQTLLVAYNNKDKVYPLENLGEDCGEALYLSGVDAPTQWFWLGYTPDLLPEQLIKIADTGELIHGIDWADWLLDNAPNPIDLVPGLREVVGDDV